MPQIPQATGNCIWGSLGEDLWACANTHGWLAYVAACPTPLSSTSRRKASISISVPEQSLLSMTDRTVVHNRRGYLFISVYFTVYLPLFLPDIVKEDDDVSG